MARPNVGMMYPVFAPITAHTDGSMPTYGTGVVIQEARNATITMDYNNNPLHGDNRIVADDNGLQEMTVSFEPTGLNDSQRMLLFGEKQGTVGGITAQLLSDNETPYGGFGFVRKMYDEVENAKKFEAWIILKVKFQEESMSTNTKEGPISWGTPTLTGRAASLYIDSSDEQRYIAHASFLTATAAKSWINTVLNVSSATT